MKIFKTRLAAGLFGVFLVFITDRIFGALVPGLPKHLNRGLYSWDSYPTNPNGYFRHQGVGPDGSVFFSIQRSRPEFEARAPHILAIGDSFTWGQGVYPEDTWPEKLGVLFGRAPVLNLARAGANVESALHQLMNSKTKPEWVIYGYVLNDTPITNPKNLHPLKMSPPREHRSDAPFHWDLFNVRPDEIRASRSAVFQFLGRWSRIFDYALGTRELLSASASTIEFYRDLHDPQKNREGLERTWAAIEAMRAESKKRGAKFIVMIFPVFFQTERDYPFTATHRFVSSELRKREIMALDLLPHFLGKPARDFWVHPVDQHPNHFAHAEIAQVLHSFMKGLKRER